MVTYLIVLTTVSFLVLSLPLLYVYAQPPAPGWGTSKNCTADTRDSVTTTCCWREKIPGSFLGQRYCQTCTYSADLTTTDCGPKVKQMGVSNDIDTSIPPTEWISDDPQAGDDRNPGIPPTEGVEDDTSNNNENGNSEDSSNTIPRKGGGLDTSNINESVIGQ